MHFYGNVTEEQEICGTDGKSPSQKNGKHKKKLQQRQIISYC